MGIKYYLGIEYANNEFILHDFITLNVHHFTERYQLNQRMEIQRKNNIRPMALSSINHQTLSIAKV